MAVSNGALSWHLPSIATSLMLTEKDVKEYFTDGRRVSFLLERRLAYEVLQGKLAPSEGAGYDLIDQAGDKWEVRSITRGGIYFCPSYMVGSGRQFDEKGFMHKLKEVKGYVISDIESFPKIPFWMVTADVVLRWYEQNKLGSGTKVSRARILELLRAL